MDKALILILENRFFCIASSWEARTMLPAAAKLSWLIPTTFVESFLAKSDVFSSEHIRKYQQK